MFISGYSMLKLDIRKASLQLGVNDTSSIKIEILALIRQMVLNENLKLSRQQLFTLLKKEPLLIFYKGFSRRTTIHFLKKFI